MIKMKLYEAIIEILKRNPNGLTSRQIAKEINDGELYEREDKKPVPSSQISARINRDTYKHLFKKEGNIILLK